MARPSAVAPAAAPPLPLAAVEEALARFQRHADAARIGQLRVERVAPHAFVLRPDQGRGKEIDLLLMALVHGNEVGGLLALNALCELLAGGLVAPAISIGLLACNPHAARQGLRQAERDMNRSFGRPGVGTAEDRRAREIEPMLRRARWCVDLHQTIEPSHTPFFVFDYQPGSLRFAHALLPEAPVVTHWGVPFSATPGGGLTTQEYVHRHGGVAVGVELGHKGGDAYQVSLGLHLCLRAIGLVTAAGERDALPPLDEVANPVYTWGEIVPYPETRVALRPGLANFQPIAAGEALGEAGGAPLRAARDGWLLFPKYVHSELEPRPAELLRLLRRTHLDELGRGDCMRPATDRTT